MDLKDFSFEGIPIEHRQRVQDVLSQISSREIYSTIGVYNSGDRISNGVASEDLLRHIGYNLKMRPGRAFFLEEHCLYEGYLSIDKIAELEDDFASHPHRPDTCSLEYR